MKITQEGGTTVLPSTQAAEEAVTRIESRETLERGPIVRLPLGPEDDSTVHLAVPSHDEVETRTHEPTLDTLLGALSPISQHSDTAWEGADDRKKSLPWLLFLVIGLLLASALAWSLTEIRKSRGKAQLAAVVEHQDTAKSLKNDESAAQFIDEIEAVTRAFFAATTVESLSRLVRHSDLVTPKMETHFKTHPIAQPHLLEIKDLTPFTLQNRADFWMVTAELIDHQLFNLIIETSGSDSPKVDWESFVCLQPMPWDDFATLRPSGKSYDFRVYLTPDHFFSHEFADSTRWHSFKLQAPHSEEVLFGYLKMDDPLAAQLSSLASRASDGAATVILRLSIPENLQSRRGVIIEKLISAQWMHIDPPPPTF